MGGGHVPRISNGLGGGNTFVRLRLWQREQAGERLLCLLVILGP